MLEHVDVHDGGAAVRYNKGVGRAEDDVDSPDGFEAWVRRLLREADPSVPAGPGRVHATYFWIVEADTKIGYEVSFTRHFYKPRPLRTLEEISADILAIEKDAQGLLDDLLIRDK